MRMRNASCLSTFYQRFSGDLPHKLFLALYNIAVSSPPPPLGYMVVNLAHPDFKYRINSFNFYYDAHDRMIKDILQAGDNGTVAALKLCALNGKVQSYIQNQQTTALAERGRRQLDSFN